MSVFYNNYVALCAKKKKSLSAVAEEIGLSRTSPNGWKKGKQPSDVNLQKLANYFGVSVAYLKGEEEQKEKPTNQPVGELSETKRMFDAFLQECTDSEAATLLAMSQAFLANLRQGSSAHLEKDSQKKR